MTMKNDTARKGEWRRLDVTRHSFYCYYSLVILFLLLNHRCAHAFRLSNNRRQQIALQSSMSNAPNDSSSTFDDDDNEQRRMAMVRMLQASFYQEDEMISNSFELPNEANGGVLTAVPIWRVPWVELPGRTNVLTVHEPHYTNMFEKLLRGNNRPLPYFGHVFLEKGASITSRALESWETNSDCLGTLMRITDYQRLKNGRLLLLVQAMERFVVQTVHQNLPYAIADVQLLPDMDDDDTPRIAKLLESQFWQSYEFEETKFASRDLVGSVLAQVLPYAAMDPTQIPTEAIMWPPTQQDCNNATTIVPNTKRDDHDLEVQLLKKGILKRFDETASPNVSTDELELQLWWAMNDYLLTSKTPVSPILLGLLPPNLEWEQDFVLNDIAKSLAHCTEYRHKYVPVSAAYPKRLRQRRLSFHAAYLCKDQDRHELLAMSSTKMRLQAVLWKIETYNRSFQ